MIETAEALENIDEILSVEGIDAIYVGPSDLSISLGLPPSNGNDGNAKFDNALKLILQKCKQYGVAPGIHSTGDLAPIRRKQGFKMITVASDMNAMRLGLESELAKVKS